MLAFGVFILFLCFISVFVYLGILLKSYILTQIWGWYIVPFFGLAPLPIIFAFGILLFVELVTLSTVGLKADMLASKSLNSVDILKAEITGLLAILLIWLMGWIGTHWLPEQPVEINTVVPIEQVGNNG